FVAGQEGTGLELQNVQAASDLSGVDAAVVPISSPMAGEEDFLRVDGATVEIRYFLRVGGIGEIHDRRAAAIPTLHQDVPARYGNNAPIVGDAIFGITLHPREFVVSPWDELSVMDAENQVGAPLRWVRLAAA